MSETVKVAVVGGGPVGLWLACELALAGVQVAVIERRTQRVEQSRALTIHGRTLEVFGLRGLADRFLASGKPIPLGHFAILDTRLDFSFIETGFPYTLFIPQRRTEELIEERARELGVTIRRGVLIEQIEERDGMTLLSGDAAGERFTLASRYLVGADGGRSLVRNHAGIDFPGQPAQRVFSMGDVVLTEPLPAPLLSHVNAQGCIIIAPLGDGARHRIVLCDAARMHDPRDRQLSLEELKASTRAILGTDFGATDPIWLSRFDDETRLAARYRAGHVFLAGDAAHIHMPAGGQGMNVGIQDAMNLGWKLAAVVKNGAPDTLLDSYETERWPIGRQLELNTLAQTALMTNFDPGGLALRETAEMLLSVPEANHRLALQLSGFGVAYPDPLPGFEAGLTPDVGERTGDTMLQLRDGTTVALFDLLAEGQWLHIAFEEDALCPMPDWLDRNTIRFVAACRTDAGICRRGAAMLIRPDGHFAAIRN